MPDVLDECQSAPLLLGQEALPLVHQLLGIYPVALEALLQPIDLHPSEDRRGREGVRGTCERVGDCEWEGGGRRVAGRAEGGQRE